MVGIEPKDEFFLAGKKRGLDDRLPEKPAVLLDGEGKSVGDLRGDGEEGRPNRGQGGKKKPQLSSFCRRMNAGRS